MDKYYVGIDLGTTNSSLAILDPYSKKIEVKRVDVGEHPHFIRTILSLDLDGKWMIGNQAAAIDQLKDRSVFSMKSELRLNSNYSLTIDGKRYVIDELIAIFLEELMRKAGIEHPQQIERLCLSVPVNFGENGKSVMEKAAIRLGIPAANVWFLDEPVSILWDCQHIQGQYMLVFDFGGGTLDLAIMDKYETEDRLKAVSHNADTTDANADNHYQGKVVAKLGMDLGGDDLDDVIIRYFIEQGKLQGNPVCENINIEIFDDPERLQRLKNHPKFTFYYQLKMMAEQTKQMLSSHSQYALSIAPLVPGVDQGIKGITMTLEQFIIRTESIRNRMMQGMMQLNVQFQQSTQLTRHNVEAVLLSGGSSLLSFVPDLLEELYPNARIVWDETHLQTRIARGNARYTFSEQEIRVGDTVNASYGIFNHAGNETIEMIDQAETYPVQKLKRVATTKPNQTAIEIAPMVKYADRTGYEPLKKNGNTIKWRMNIKPHVQFMDLSRITVTYTIDKSQRMQVSAFDHLFETEVGVEEVSLLN